MVGNSVGVRAGGRLAVNVRKIHVEALPKDLPDFIEIDISNMEIGDKQRVSEMKLKGVTFLDAQNVVVAAVTVTRNTKDEDELAKGADAKTAVADPNAPVAEVKAPEPVAKGKPEPKFPNKGKK